jgi:class 3 adenylate cyclase/DNA-binding CsgD family transcriptional regulator/tetratricopeptide (TPR) repeat protein
MMLPTGTVTFLFTDIQGSTPLWEVEPDKMAEALLIHNSALRQAIEAKGGVVFKTVGDAFQAAFPTAPQALQAALDGQRALHISDWNELGPLKARMGLHTGKAELDPEGDEYAVSHTKNRVARIMSAAHGGQVLLSLSTAELLRGHLPWNVTLKDLGEHHLKGLLQPEHVFQVLAPDLPVDFPAPNTITRPQENHLTAILARFAEEHPTANVNFLDSTVYSFPLAEEEQQQFIQLLRFARTLQLEKPVYESVYHHLLYLYVLNGSRLDLLRGIDRLLRGLVDGQGGLLMISGVSGIGKTSSVMAFQERVHQLGAQFILVHSFEQDGTSYILWQNVVEAVSVAAGQSIRSLPAPIGDGPYAQSAHQLNQALTRWLEHCASVQPLVIVLDDLQWADVDSLEVLNILTSHPKPAPILFIATYRSEETDRSDPLYTYLPQLQRNRPHTHFHLAPLTREDTSRLVTAYQGTCSPQLAVYMQERAEGHPLFTVELLNDLITQKLLSQDQEGRWLPPEQSVPVPKILKQLILQRVSRLGSQVERLLSVAAIAGEFWSLKVIEPLLDMPEREIITAVENVLRSEIILIEDDQAEIYRFSHGLVRQVLYTAQLARQRKQIHAQIAAQFEIQQPGNIFATAHHFFEGEAWEKAVTCFQMAGDEAIQHFAYHSALQCYQKALAAAERTDHAFDETSLQIYDRLGRIHRALEQREQAEVVYSRMRDLARNSGDLNAEGHALVNLAFVRALHYQLGLSETTANEALRIGEQIGDAVLLSHVHTCLGSLLLFQGQLDEAKEHFRQVFQNAEVMPESSMLLDTLRLSAYRTIWQSQYAEAENYAREALHMARQMADPLAVVGAFQNLSFVQIEQGQYIEAYHNIHAMLDDIEDAGSNHHQKPRLLNLMGYLYLELGDAQTALQWDQKALEAIQSIHTQTIEMLRYSLLNQATDYLHLGQLDQVQETIDQFEVIHEAPAFMKFRYTNRYQLLLCEWYLHQERYEQAVDVAQVARALAQAHGMVKNIAKSHWFEGQATGGMMRFNDALDHLEKAADLADSIQHGSLRWKARVTLAETMLKAGRPADAVTGQARALVNQAIQSLTGSPLHETLLASPWIHRLTELEGSPSSEKNRYPAGLTEREVEVLRLVASGATNQQIAAVLHISVRTVNTHMTNILNKTVCENRTAASAFAIQHHLVS